VRSNRSYTARVLGTSALDDVAVLRLQGARGLKTVSIANSARVRVGDRVIAAGNANGSGGPAEISAGVVVRLNRSLKVNDGSGGTEHLTGLIQTSASLEPGESGGPLYNSAGRVIGMDTAASFSGRGATEGFAIPINRALAIVRQVQSGRETERVRIGPPAFLGVRVDARAGTRAGGALLAGVISGTPAARAGLRAGDVITAVDGTVIASANGLGALIARRDPGDVVVVAWTDTSGHEHTASLTLTEGPAA